MQRWALILSAYTYTLEFRRTEDHGNADALSRFPMKSVSNSAKGFPPFSLYFVEFFETGVTFENIKNHTKDDLVLAKVVDRLLHGWKREGCVLSVSSVLCKREICRCMMA